MYSQHDNVLMCAAIGLNGVPDPCTFYTEFYERKHLFSIEERVQGLEVLGSTHILRREFDQGLKCWKKAASIRTTPRTPLPLADLPPISSKLFKPEWTTFDDLLQLSLPQPAARVTETNPDFETYEAGLELTYQAMLIRLRYCKSNSRPDVLTLWRSRWYLVPDGGVLYVKYGFFVLEWDELYAKHSHSLNDHGTTSIVREHFLEQLSNLSSTCHRDIICFESLMLLLKWSATEIEKWRLSHDRRQGLFKAVDWAVQAMGIMVVNNLLNDDGQVEFQTCIERMVVADDHDLQSSLFYACVSIYCFDFLSNLNNEMELFLMRKQLVRLFIEAGADINSVDNYGEHCLHYFVNEDCEDLTDQNLRMFRVLLDCGSRWEASYFRRPTPLKEYNRKLTVFFQAILPSDGFFSLQWLCVRILRANKLRESASNKMVPRAIVEMINDF